MPKSYNFCDAANVEIDPDAPFRLSLAKTRRPSVLRSPPNRPTLNQAASQAKRHHPARVVLRWLLATLILLKRFLGYTMLRPPPDSDPEKLRPLILHRATALLIAALTLIRIAIRLRTRHLRTRRPRTRPLTTELHLGLDALVLAMPLTGMTLALSAHLTKFVVRPKGTLPETPATTPATGGTSSPPALLPAPSLTTTSGSSAPGSR